MKYVPSLFNFATEVATPVALHSPKGILLNVYVKVHIQFDLMKIKKTEEDAVLSVTTEYALRAVTCLASQQACGQMSWAANELATVTKIPRRYLHRVMQRLVAAGIVDSRCGSQGGYALKLDVKLLTILDVVNAVEPLPRICSCPLNLKSHTSLCPLHAELDRAYAACEDAFRKVTIHDLLNSTGPIVPLQP
jgi:Rrf2 family protein